METELASPRLRTVSSRSRYGAPALASASCAGCFISALLWLVVFLIFRSEIWHAMQTIGIFGAAMGVVGTMAAGTLNGAGPASTVTAAGGAAVGGGLGFAFGGALLVLAPTGSAS